MTDGVLINMGGTVVSKVYGYGAKPPVGQAFVPCDPTEKTPGTVVSASELNAAAAYTTFINNGLTLTSAGTPALNGVYALDQATQDNISSEAQFITQFQEFTNGGTSGLQWPLTNGTLISFPSTVAFMNYTKASGQQVAAAKLAVFQGSTIMPSSNVTIP